MKSGISNSLTNITLGSIMAHSMFFLGCYHLAKALWMMLRGLVS